MTYNELVEFLTSKMSMSHVYQPVVIRSLVDAGGLATVRQLAQAFLLQDESQLLYYEKRIKEMPLKVLRKHGIVQDAGNVVSLTVPCLTLEQRAHIRMLCEQRLQSFVQKKGLSLWDYRLLDTDPIPDSLRYQVLKASGGRCALCGATKNERPLDVDHIIPRSRGGKNELANLQVLCSKCNRSKRDQDDTDFRNTRFDDRDASCVFCGDDLGKRTVAENGSVIAIEDKYPVTPGHLLVLPRRHVADYFAMTSTERAHSDELIRVLRSRIMFEDKKVAAFNIGTNCGTTAGQTVKHAHIHVIPRRAGDIGDPRGGVRGVIPERRVYEASASN
jgi:diadenosine tetraphosphate (Ap4A) HIT family hydrolase